MAQATSGARGTVREFFTGVRTLFAGFSLWRTDFRLMAIGALPAIIVGLLFVGLFLFLAFNGWNIASAIGGFSTGWGETWYTIVRWVILAALVGGSAVLVVFTFTALTLAVGGPFYEKIWRSLEESLGTSSELVELGTGESIRRGVSDSIRFLFITLGVGLLLFVVGLIPVVGTISAGILGAVFGGWIIALELTSFAFEGRGFRLADRRKVLGYSRARVLGFGMSVWALFLIPLGAVLTMPVAVAGATVLSRASLARYNGEQISLKNLNN